MRDGNTRLRLPPARIDRKHSYSSIEQVFDTSGLWGSTTRTCRGASSKRRCPPDRPGRGRRSRPGLAVVERRWRRPGVGPQAPAVRAEADLTSRQRPSRRRCRTPSCTATPTSRSSTAPRTPSSWSRRPPGSASRRWRSPTTTGSTASFASPRRPAPSGCRRCSAPRSPWPPALSDAAAGRRSEARHRCSQVDTGALPDPHAARPARQPPRLLADGPDRLRPPRPGAQPRPPRGGEGRAAVHARRHRRCHAPATAGCSPGAARAPCPRRWSTDGPAAARRELQRLIDAFGRDRVVVELWDHGDPLDSARNDALAELAARARRRRASPPTTSTTPRPPQRRLATAIAAVRARRSLDEIDPWLPAATGAHLRSGAEQARRFARYPGVVEPAAEIGRAAAFDLSLVAPEPAAVPVPAPTAELTEMQYLRQLVEEGGRHRYGERPSAHEDLSLRARAWTTIDHELDVIEQLGFPGYFLVVWDIVEFCRRADIFCQGRGSAANSAVVLRARHHQGRCGVARVCCSSGSCRPSATGRPTSTSTSRATGGRRSSSTSTSATAATTPRRSPTSSPTAPARRCATWPRRSATRRASRTRGASRSMRGATCRRTADQPDHGIPAAVLDLADGDRGRPAPPRHPLRRDGHLRPSGDRGVPGRVGPDGQAQRAAVGQGRLRRGRVGEVRPARSRHAQRARTTPSISSASTAATRSTWPPSRRRTRSTRCCAAPTPSACSRSNRGRRWPRCRGCKPRRFYDLVVEVALIRPGPIQGGSVHPVHPPPQRAGADHLSAPAARELARQDARCAAVPGAADADGDRRRRVHAGRGRRAAPGDGLEARQGADGAVAGPAVRGMAERGITGDVADEIFMKMAAFANYGFPESHASASRTSSTPRRGSSSTSRRRSARHCSTPSRWGSGARTRWSRMRRRHGVVVRSPDLNASLATATLEPCAESVGDVAVRLGIGSVRGVGNDLAKEIEAGQAVRVAGRSRAACARRCNCTTRGDGDGRVVRGVLRPRTPRGAVGGRRGSAITAGSAARHRHRRTVAATARHGSDGDGGRRPVGDRRRAQRPSHAVPPRRVASSGVWSPRPGCGIASRRARCSSPGSSPIASGR